MQVVYPPLSTQYQVVYSIRYILVHITKRHLFDVKISFNFLSFERMDTPTQWLVNLMIYQPKR